MAGEPDALVESFAAEPELYDPVRGRVKGTRAFKAFITEMSSWLARHNVSVEDVEHVVTERRGFEEVVLHLDGETGRVDLPLAFVADRHSDGRIDELRIYSSNWPLTGRHANRPPLLQPDPELRESDVVAEYQRALAAGDVDAIVAAFEPDGYVREPAGGQYIHRGPDVRARSTSCCSRTTAASHWNTARSSTTSARARSNTTSYDGARRSCRPRPGSLSMCEVRAASSLRPASTTTSTPRLLQLTSRFGLDAPLSRRLPAIDMQSFADDKCGAFGPRGSSSRIVCPPPGRRSRCTGSWLRQPRKPDLHRLVHQAVLSKRS